MNSLITGCCTDLHDKCLAEDTASPLPAIVLLCVFMCVCLYLWVFDAFLTCTSVRESYHTFLLCIFFPDVHLVTDFCTIKGECFLFHHHFHPSLSFFYLIKQNIYRLLKEWLKYLFTLIMSF